MSSDRIGCSRGIVTEAGKSLTWDATLHENQEGALRDNRSRAAFYGAAFDIVTVRS